MTERRRYLLSYDVSDDKRRTSLFRLLRDYGDHVQYSVFLSELNTRELAVLRGRAIPMLDHTTDQLLILDLGSAKNSVSTALEVLGKPYEPPARVRVV